MEQQLFGFGRAPAASHSEKRSERRRRVLKGGTILFNKGFNSYECKVRNLSETGALVETDSTHGIPVDLDFVIGNERSNAKAAKIVWRTNHFIGLSFEQ